MQVIGIAGKMGAGKDTIADVLVAHHGFRRLSMADALRAECAGALDTGIAPVGCPNDIRLVIESDGWHPDAVYAKPTGASMRRLLQWWGTEYRRTQDRHYWVKRTAAIIRDSRIESVVIPDIRFDNEASMVRLFGGQVWIVRRSQDFHATCTDHVSEQFADSAYRWDAELQNDGTVADLGGKVRDIMRCNKELRRLNSELEGVQAGIIDWQRELREVSLPIDRVAF